MNINVIKIKKCIRRIEAMVLAVMIVATSLSYTVVAIENNSEQELIVEQEEESEQGNIVSLENTKVENIELGEKEEDKVPEQENEPKIEEVPEQENEPKIEEVPEQENEPKIEEALEQENEPKVEENPESEDETEEVKENEIEEELKIEEEIVLEVPGIEYSVQTSVDGYKIKLEAYDGVFPEGEELSLLAKQIKDQNMLDEIDSKLSDVCEGEFRQISFDIKVLNAAGEELQPADQNILKMKI